MRINNTVVERCTFHAVRAPLVVKLIEHDRFTTLFICDMVNMIMMVKIHKDDDFGERGNIMEKRIYPRARAGGNERAGNGGYATNGKRVSPSLAETVHYTTSDRHHLAIRFEVEE